MLVSRLGTLYRRPDRATQAATAGDFKQATTLTGRFIRCVSLIRSYTVLFAVSSPHAWE